MTKRKNSLRSHVFKLHLFAIALLIFGVAAMPALLTRNASAAQITNRSLTISSGVPGNTSVTYTFTFTIPTAGQIQGLKFTACTTAVGTYAGGTCVAPIGMTFATAAFDNKSGWAAGSADFAADTVGANDCTPAANVLCANRTDTSSETATAHTIAFNTIKNPTTTNTAFYVGIQTYTTNNYTAGSEVDFGTTASAVVQTLTTHAAVAEVLQFCVGATTVDDTTTNVANDCSVLGGTSVNLGTLDTSAINISPETTNGGDGNNGVAMIRSNAGNGTVVAYDAIQATGTNHRGTLRISGATCDHPGSQVGYPQQGFDGTNDFTDDCINAAGTQQQVLFAGTEMFGMTIAGINHGSTTSYTCTYGTPPGNTCNMQPLTGASGVGDYLGQGTGSSDAVYGTSNGFAWDETGTAVNIASSAASTVKQVDDEALILKFAATPSITTPFGPYSVQTDFIAIPTY